MGPIHSPRTYNLNDTLGHLHGKRRRDIYVLISKDGSTLLKDPGLERPWSSPNRKYAEDTARIHNKAHPEAQVVAVDLETAVMSVIKHPKNLPNGQS